MLVLGGRAAERVASAASALGHEVERGGAPGPFALVIAEAQSPAQLEALLAEHGALDACALVLVRRRLRAGEGEAFRGAGAKRVLDLEASVLDALLALVELSCSCRAERRRHGGVPVRIRALTAEEGPRSLGLLVDLTRAGACLMTERRLAQGTAVELELALGDRPVALRGRVAFSPADEREGLAVEFALDDAEVAPRLALLFEAPSDPPRRLPDTRSVGQAG